MAKRYVRNKKRRARRRLLLVMALLAVALLAAILILTLSSGGQDGATQEGKALWNGSWYGDDLGRIDSDKALIRGMKAFERKTGTRPYLFLTGGVDPTALEDFAKAQHEALFADGSHLLVVYDEWGDDAYYLSAQRGRVSTLTAEDVSVLLSSLEAAYADPANPSYADAFGAGFRQGGEAIAHSESDRGVGLLLVLGGILIVLSVVLILFLRKRARDMRRFEAARWEDDGEDEDA